MSIFTFSGSQMRVRVVAVGKKIDMVLDGAEVIEGRDVQLAAGKYKCEPAISLSDCSQ